MSDTPETCPVPAPAPPWRPDWLWLAVALLVGGTLRYLLRDLAVHPVGDAVHYLNQARAGGLASVWNPVGQQWVLPPLYPLLVALFGGRGASPIDAFEAAKSASWFVGTLTPLALYFATQPLLGLPAARWTLLLAVIDPLLAHYSTVVYAEPLYLLLMLLLLVATLHWARGSHLAGILAPLLGLALYLTRAFGLVAFPLAFTGLALARAREGTLDGCLRKQSLSAWAIFLVGAGCYIGTVSTFEGHLAFDGKSRYQFLRLTAPDLTAEQRDPNYEGLVNASGTDYDPAQLWFEPLAGKDRLTIGAKKYLLRLRRVFYHYLVEPVPPYSIHMLAAPLLLLIGAGLTLAWQRIATRSWTIWGTLTLGTILLQCGTFLEPRYFVVLVPLLLPLAGLALSELACWLKSRFDTLLERPLHDVLLGACVVAASALVLIPSLQTLRDPGTRTNPYREAAETLAATLPEPPERIFDTGGLVAYYLDTEGLVVPDLPPERLADFARRHGVGYLALDHTHFRTKHPRVMLQFLYDSPQSYPTYGLTLLASNATHGPGGWRLYAIDTPIAPGP